MPVAFATIAKWIDEIELGFLNHESPEKIAKRLGIYKQRKTIRRYKEAVWNLRDMVDETKEERANNHDARHEQARVDVVATLDLIDVMKQRAFEDLQWVVGSKYMGQDGKTEMSASPGQVSNWHVQAGELAAKAIKAEMEISGDDPTSKGCATFLEVMRMAIKAKTKGGSDGEETDDR